MKRSYKIQTIDGSITREYNYIPVRYIFAIMLTVFEVVSVVLSVVVCCYYIPYFYIAAFITEIVCVISITSSDDNPEYKVPWLVVVLVLPIAGFMLYFLFYKRTLDKRYIKRLKNASEMGYNYSDDELFDSLANENLSVAERARMLTRIADTAIFDGGKQDYFPLGEEKWARLIHDLESAKKFIFLEYFIIEDGEFWGTILDVLKRKAKDGVEVRVVYDDIGCMSTLPGNYDKILSSYGILSVPFSRLRGNADGEFNNRSHRKIAVIDGLIGYTGGINIADEYVNKTVRFGHWKDSAIRIVGDGVRELTRLFITDYIINSKKPFCEKQNYYPDSRVRSDGYVIPFGDGPKPIYEHNVGKTVIKNMLDTATDYAYITTPYLIMDNELLATLENAALRGVDVRIITPGIPDKKLVYEITRSFYPRLMHAGVKIYEYTPGFIHQKTYLVDGNQAMVGTINLDYRSLTHNFECGVWMYGTKSIYDIKKDIDETIAKSHLVQEEELKVSVVRRMVRATGRVFATLL